MPMPKIKDKFTTNKENYQLALNQLDTEEQEILEESMRL